MMPLYSYEVAAFYTGFLGDLALQVFVQMGVLDAGLGPYFALHKPFESACIAAGLMYLCGLVYVTMYNDEPTDYRRPFIFGVGLDILFRYGRLMPTLDTYYAALSPLTTMVWGGIPMVMAVYFRDWMAARPATP